MNVLVVGAGVFGVAAARELARRGHDVRVIDAGAVPRPEASSSDLSRAVRLDYGGDVFWTEMAEVCMPKWREWDARWRSERGASVLHRDGFLFLTRQPIAPGSFEYDSMFLLESRGHELERLDEAAIRQRFPAFDAQYVDGYLNPHDGWVASGRVVELLAAEAREAGVEIEENVAIDGFLEKAGVVSGVRCVDGRHLHADVVVATMGSWMPNLFPGLRGFLRCSGQSVFYLEVEDPDRWRAPRLPTWSADISQTGWYGFPAVGNVVKIANHGPGRELTATDRREVLAEEEAMCRAFLADSLPVLAAAPIVERRVCAYCDTLDGAFLIDQDRRREGLVVATGGSGHAFKFAPLLGELVADAVEQKSNRWAHRFCWRQKSAVEIEGARRR